MQIPESVRKLLRPIKAFLKPITSSAKFKRFFPLIVIVGTMTFVGSSYALYQTFALTGGRVTIASCIASPETEPVFRQVWVRANNGTQVEAYVYPRNNDAYRPYMQTSPVNGGQAYFRYFMPVDADIEVFGISGSKVYFEDKAVIVACPNATYNPSTNTAQPNGGDNADGNGGGDYSTYYGSAPTGNGGSSSAPKLNPEGTDCHTYTLQYDPNYSYSCVSHLQNDLGISADGVFGAGTLSSVKAFQARNGLTADGVVGPATWCKIHGDLCGGGATSPSNPAPVAAAKQNPDGTDCHNYTLKYDPNYTYPCVKHLQVDLNISADGVFGPNTQTAVKNFQSKHGLTVDGVVGPATWCKLHADLPGCASAPVATSATQGVQGRIFRDDNANGSKDSSEPLIGTCGGGLDVDASVSANGQTRNADMCNPGPFYRIDTPANGQTVSVNPPPGWSSTNGNTRNVTVQAGKYTDVGPWFGIRPTTTNTNTTPVSSTNGGVAITGLASGRCLDVPGQNFSNGVGIQIYDCNGSKAQKWTALSNGAIQINGNKCLDVNGGSTSNGASVIIWDCHYGSNQQWTGNADGTLRSNKSGKCLDVKDASKANEAKLQIWDCHVGENQRWR